MIERDLRNAMKDQQITDLPLYPEQRACAQPTADRALELFANLARHHLTREGQHVQTFPPQLTAPLQADVPHVSLAICAPTVREAVRDGHCAVTRPTV